MNKGKDELIGNEIFFPDHYHGEYIDLERFISYFYQIDTVLKLDPKTILEIGIGNDLVSYYLKKSGFHVTTCDINENLKPDKVGDIRNLPFENEYFDLVFACEVLEHIPFEDLQRALSELKRVTKKHAVISIPYPGFFSEIVLNINVPFFGTRKIRSISQIPFFLHEHKKGEHFWEMGRKNNSKAKIKELLNEYFHVVNEFQPVLNPYHYFFLLEKK